MLRDEVSNMDSGGTSGPSFFPGQKGAIGDSIFSNGGIFQQFLAGKPNAGFERAQRTGKKAAVVLRELLA